MDKVDAALVLGMLCLIAGTLMVGFSRPLWWMLHQRKPGERRCAPRRYEWYLRVPGIALLLAAGWVIVMSVTNSFVFQ